MKIQTLLWCVQAVCFVNLAAAHRRRDCGCADTARDTGHGTHGQGEGQRPGNSRDHAHPRGHGRPGENGHPATHGICHVQTNPRGGGRNASIITGDIYLRRQRSNGTEIKLDLHGFRGNGKPHAMHIHEFGDLSDGCETLGGHFNPHNMDHGSHAGDLGNFRPSADGSVHETLTRVQLHLQGHDSVIGRSIVIHENEDDLGHHDSPGSLVHGNAGRRLACCVIGVASGRGWHQAVHSPSRVSRNQGRRENSRKPQRSEQE
ncbi:superoxide dismutase [Cu-Zn], chloroplastic-like [Scyliorhinus canicula]|uniref:superoxide dismutase [Cu-Zn], chloroplastic-like n=1 Tax=Scyliorhinus canicula TaxID=7830 RepID=UPI0018F54198|nr:superoxide dismutase [Cu-Zn], chloroplastic-like [Scyliorhinus canicula]